MVNLKLLDARFYKSKGYPSKKFAIDLLKEKDVNTKSLTPQQIPTLQDIAPEFRQPINIRMTKAKEFKQLGYKSKKEALQVIKDKKIDKKNVKHLSSLHRERLIPK